MADLDALAERAVATVTALIRKGATIVTGVLVFALCSAALCLLIASAGLAGSARSVALALAIGLSIVAVGAAVLARWRLGRVGTHSRELVSEVRTLLDRDQQARQTVVETVEMQDAAGARSMMVWTRQYDTLRRGTATLDEFKNLNSALLAVTSFPGLVVLSLLSALALGGLSLIFAIGAVL
jgi:hypothetical protein